jgi:hypothetical protein
MVRSPVSLSEPLQRSAVAFSTGVQRARHRLRRRSIIQHRYGRRPPSVPGTIVPDKLPAQDDEAIAERLLRAHDACERDRPRDEPGGPDVWTHITATQNRFASILARRDPHELAGYLCNVSRHDASAGIVQGDVEHARIERDGSYRAFVLLMAMDKLVSLAEALGVLAVENPEAGTFGASLRADPRELVERIGERLGIDITPPDVDGGLLKLDGGRGLFGERDLNAIYTAYLMRSIVGSERQQRVCEIGGGSGRVAYWSHQLGLMDYTIVDLPHVNVVQGYYVLKSIAGERVQLYGEQSPPDAASPRLRIVPPHAIDDLGGTPFGLVVNQDSFPEMNVPTVDRYLRWIRGSCDGLLLSINHESKPAYGRGLTHISVPERIAACGGFALRQRFPYWMRRGYVVETYGVTAA